MAWHMSNVTEGCTVPLFDETAKCIVLVVVCIFQCAVSSFVYKHTLLLCTEFDWK